MCDQFNASPKSANKIVHALSVRICRQLLKDGNYYVHVLDIIGCSTIQ